MRTTGFLIIPILLMMLSGCGAERDWLAAQNTAKGIWVVSDVEIDEQLGVWKYPAETTYVRLSESRVEHISGVGSPANAQWLESILEDRWDEWVFVLSFHNSGGLYDPSSWLHPYPQEIDKYIYRVNWHAVAYTGEEDFHHRFMLRFELEDDIAVIEFEEVEEAFQNPVFINRGVLHMKRWYGNAS